MTEPLFTALFFLWYYFFIACAFNSLGIFSIAYLNAVLGIFALCFIT